MKTVLNAFEGLAKRQIVKEIAVELGVDKTTVKKILKILWYVVFPSVFKFSLYFKTVVLNWDIFASRRHIDCLLTSGERTGMLLNILQDQGQPPTGKNYLVLNVNRSGEVLF